MKYLICFKLAIALLDPHVQGDYALMFYSVTCTVRCGAKLRHFRGPTALVEIDEMKGRNYMERLESIYTPAELGGLPFQKTRLN